MRNYFDTEATYSAADAINEAYAAAKAAGTTVTFKGREVKAWGKPASVYQNGTLAVFVAARTTRGLDTVYVKAGQPIPAFQVK